MITTLIIRDKTPYFFLNLEARFGLVWFVFMAYQPF